MTFLSSLPIGSLLGIRVRLHWLLIVMMAVVVFVLSPEHGGWLSFLTIVALFSIVLLHELGHCLVARRHGIQVIDITLWPLGGMARMSAIPESPRIEAQIAIAGPAVNFALAALSLPLALLDGRAFSLPTAGSDLLRWFVAANVVMGLFNLLPAFPMDGGRLLRAFLARRGDWLGATERAVRWGRWIAFCLLALGLIGVPGHISPSLSLALVAAFIWWSGLQELLLVRARHARHPLQRIFEMLATRARERAALSSEERVARAEVRDHEVRP